ncbi:putative metal dependent phosphohydrolase [Escherichia phage AV124]|nr:putative metal dependent phosphohydrolase [Escherichia phage AV124]
MVSTDKSCIQALSPAQELALAIKIAAEGHLNQKDKGGNPYILHPLKVMHYLKTDDFQLMAIAALHDVIEDTDVMAADLVMMGFSNRVVCAVVLLTKTPNQSPEEYFQGIASNYDAVRVKLADLRHNSDVRRLKGLTDKDLLRVRKYHDMYLRLTKMKEHHEAINVLSKL